LRLQSVVAEAEDAGRAAAAKVAAAAAAAAAAEFKHKEEDFPTLGGKAGKQGKGRLLSAPARAPSAWGAAPKG